MKSYHRIVWVLLILYSLATLAFVILTGQDGGVIPGRDNAVIILNDITREAGNTWSDLDRLGDQDFGIDFAVLNNSDDLLYASRPDEARELSLASAMKKGDLYACVIVGDRVAGYVILMESGRGKWLSTRTRIITGLVMIGILLFVLALLFDRYVTKSIIIPFNNMKEFAGDIAAGRLDAPLAMDRGNLFGAFTESFDIMREELRSARKREIALQQRERELVASLSHDLKTPVTGIRVTCELLKAKLESGQADQFPDHAAFAEKLDNICRKADQIDALLSDLFSSAMEELDELKVSCADESSEVLNDILRRYDDRELVSAGDLPRVLIRTDRKRMSQVIGNIIANSYKYANTGIEVSYRLVDDYLEMDIRDFGPGVPEDELNLITNRFYRGKQWADSKEEGSGLGLYIARLLMEKMDGGLLPVCSGEGLTITLMIPLC